MDRIVSVTCPRCGAQLAPTPGSPQATCGYCGTISFIEQRPPPVASRPYAAPKAANAMLPVAIGCAVLALAAGAALSAYFMMRSTPSDVGALVQPAPTIAVAPSPSPSSIISAAAPAVPPIAISEGFQPLVVDANGDGTADVVIAISTTGSSSSEHYAAFDGRTGHELARTPAITDRNQAVTAIVGRRLITASHAGQLSAYGLGTGSQQWTTALGARASRLCAQKSTDAVLIATDDQRRISVDLTTGRQSPSNEPCSSVLARADNDDDPRDRHDYRAPLGMESYDCGGVTVMGDQNYTVADQCLARAHIDTDHLDGMVGHRLWKVDQSWLVFGIRKPGAKVPMVGLLTRGKLAWKAEVPLDNPLEAEEGGPQYVTLAGGLLVVSYQTSSTQHSFVTAFAVSDGTRRWTTPLVERARRVSALVSSPERVFVLAASELFLLNAADGKLVATIGKSD